MKKEKEVAEEVSAQQTAQEQTPSAEEKIATLEKQVEQLSQEKEKLTKTVARLQS